MSKNALLKLASSINHHDGKKESFILYLLQECPDVYRTIKLLLLLEKDLNQWSISSSEGEFFHVFELASYFDNCRKIFYDFVSNNKLSYKASGIKLERLIFNGQIDFLFKIVEINPQFFKRNLFYLLFNYIILPKYLFDDYLHSIVFTSGSNDNLSLGNPLGTSKRQKILFKGIRNFITKNVVFGSSVTIFLGDTASESENIVFISGKLGEKHYMTPQLFKLINKPVCAAAGNAHAIICCKKSYYCFGDNSKNQLGIGSQIQKLDILKHFDLTQFLAGSEILNCATSNNHTVIVTTNDLLVCGSNFGQLGEYVARAYHLYNPKSFIRTLRQNSISSKAFGLALADDITVFYRGFNCRIFFEYHDYNLVLNNLNNAKNCHIIGATVFKDKTSSQTIVILCSSIFEIYVWRKSTNSKTLESIWVASQTNVFFSMSNLCTSYSDNIGFSSFNCDQNGNFIICYNKLLYQGSFFTDLDSKQDISFTVNQTLDVPGLIEKTSLSRDGKSVAFILVEKEEENFDLKLQEKFEKRMNIMNLLTKGVKSNLIIIKVLAKSQTFYVHKFIITIRAPKLLNFIEKNNQNSYYIDLSQFNNSTVEEFIQFLYLNTSVTLKIFKREATTHMVNIFMENMCSDCKKQTPIIDFDIFDKKDKINCGFILFLGNILSVPEYVEKLESSLNRLIQIAKKANVVELVEMANSALDCLQDTYQLDYINNYLPNNFNINEIFNDDDSIELRCDDGKLKFSKTLLNQTEYFNTLFRWNDVCSVCLDGTTVETASIALSFFISYDLGSLELNLIQKLDLLFFADKYLLIDLISEIANMLKSEMYLDNFEIIIELSSIFNLIKLDEVIVNFLIDNIPFLFGSEQNFEKIKLFPRRILMLFCENVKKAKYLKKKEYESFIDQFNYDKNKGKKLYENFEQLAVDLFKDSKIDIFDNNCSVEEFSTLLNNMNLKNLSRNQMLINNKPALTSQSRVIPINNFIVDTSLINSQSLIETDINKQNEIDNVSLSNTSQSCIKNIERKPQNLCWNLNQNVSVDNVVSSAAQLAVDDKNETLKNPWKKSELILTKTSPLNWLNNMPPVPSNVPSLNTIMNEEKSNKEKKINDKIHETKISLPSASNWTKSLTSTYFGTPLSPQSLREIQEKELALEHAKNQLKIKPFYLLQTEELAIRELENYYINLFSNEQPAFFVVSRTNNLLNNDSSN